MKKRLRSTWRLLIRPVNGSIWRPDRHDYLWIYMETITMLLNNKNKQMRTEIEVMVIPDMCVVRFNGSIGHNIYICHRRVNSLINWNVYFRDVTCPPERALIHRGRSATASANPACLQSSCWRVVKIAFFLFLFLSLGLAVRTVSEPTLAHDQISANSMFFWPVPGWPI